MFKNIADRIANKAENAATSAARSKANAAAQTAENNAKAKFKAFVANLTKVNKKITGALITEFEDFQAQWEEKADDPRQSLFLFLMAAHHYAQGDKEKGTWMTSLILPKPSLVADQTSPTGFKVNPGGDGVSLEQMAAHPEIVKSYLGGTPANNYEIDVENLVMHIVAEGQKGSDATIIIQSAGKDQPTPCNLRKNNDGQWKLFSISSIATDVQQTDFAKGNF